jgi:hypothetical protein
MVLNNRAAQEKSCGDRRTDDADHVGAHRGNQRVDLAVCFVRIEVQDNASRHQNRRHAGGADALS